MKLILKQHIVRKMEDAISASLEPVERIELTAAEYEEMRCYCIGGPEDPLRQRLNHESGIYRCMGVPVVMGHG